VKTVAVIQARMGSTRLPGKVLKPLGDKTVLWWVIERTKAAQYIDEVVVATTTEREDDEIINEARKCGVFTFRGSAEDVLSRYYGAARARKADIVVRVTSDCPLLDPAVIDRIIKTRKENDADYCSNTLERSYPHGADVEAFTFKSLEKAHNYAEKRAEREHVTPYIWSRPRVFKLVNVLAPPDLTKPDLRITIDTEADYMFAKSIYHHLGNRIFSLSEIINLINTQPWLPWINKGVLQKKVFNSQSELANQILQYIEGARVCISQDLPFAAEELITKAGKLMSEAPEEELNNIKVQYDEVKHGVEKKL